jgi:potassium efflux system protein
VIRGARLARLAGTLVLALAVAAPAIAQQPDPAASIRAANNALQAQIAATAASLDDVRARLAATERAMGDLQASLDELERRAEVHAIGKEFARSLVHELQRLPRPGRFDADTSERLELLTATSDANLRAEQARRQLDDLDAAAERSLALLQPPPAAEQRPQVRAELRAALAEQRDLLTRMDALQIDLMKAVRALDSSQRELDRQYAAARRKLTQILYWIPAAANLQTWRDLGPALQWTFSPANWRSAARVVGMEFARQPLWPAAGLLSALLLLAARRGLRSRLVTLAPASVGLRQFGLRHALAALACTAALALPGPLILWILSMLLTQAPADASFAHALAEALSGAARLLLALTAFAWLLDRRGMAVTFFGGDADALAYTSRAVRRFAALFVPLLFAAALSGLDFTPWSNRESLGRLLLIIACLLAAAFTVRLLRRSSPLMQPLFAHAPRGLAAGTHWLWAGVLILIPLGIAGLAIAGYFVVAGFLLGRLLISLFVVLAAVTLYGLMALWVQVARYRLDLQRDERAAHREAGARADGAALPAQRLDLAAMGEQTASLLDLFVTALLIAGLWWVWRDALPNLNVVAEYSLWTVTDNVAGKELPRPLTIGALLLAFVVAVLTIVVVRKVGALLDIALLQRFDLQADATYAIKVIARYVVAAGGVVIVARILSIEWSDAQWLVAALGVGLGFGLQEIVANFVSGLIVLAERPIRVGDVVTVGDITGTVTAIRARSTRIVDFDRKEVIIPNKAFITERVTNWTLSDRMTRVVLKVSVAYGTDLAKLRRVLLETLKANPEVLPSPPPAVLMIGFGDSSLDFDLHAFIDSADKRLHVRDRLYVAIEGALRENGIEIPFPQRDVHIRPEPRSLRVRPDPPPAAAK